MPRGRKKNYKGAHRHFTDPSQVDQREEKERKEREWRKLRGELTDSDESGEDETGEKKAKPAKVVKDYGSGTAGAMPPSESESDSDSDPYDDLDGKEKHKGVEHLISLENPNLNKPKLKKVTALDADTEKTELTRKEREELQKQQAKANYMKAHLAGKTEEAQADLARLALIRKQREEATMKRDIEKKAAEEKKNLAEKKLLEKKKAAS